MEIKPQEVNTPNNPIIFDTQALFNQVYINDLSRLLKTNSTVPTYIPKKLLSCFYLYKSGADYRLYIYIDNSWKYSTLS